MLVTESLKSQAEELGLEPASTEKASEGHSDIAFYEITLGWACIIRDRSQDCGKGQLQESGSYSNGIASSGTGGGKCIC